MAEQTCCTTGFFGRGQPKGKDGVRLGGLDCYVSKPIGTESPKCCVVVATDLFGLRIVNPRLIADKFADAGFLVIVPDILGKYALEPTGLDQKSLAGQAAMSLSERLYSKYKFVCAVPSVIAAVWALPVEPTVAALCAVVDDAKKQYGVSKVGMQGYCWGGKHAIRIAHDTEHVNAVVVAHPARINVPGDIERIRVPSMFHSPELDYDFSPSKRAAAEKIFATREASGKETVPEHIFINYPNMFHAFADRGDESDPETRAAMEKHLTKSIEFHRKHLSN